MEIETKEQRKYIKRIADGNFNIKTLIELERSTAGKCCLLYFYSVAYLLPFYQWDPILGCQIRINWYLITRRTDVIIKVNRHNLFLNLFLKYLKSIHL